MTEGKTMRLGLLGRNYSLTLDLPAPRWLLDVAIECADCAVEEAEVRVLECPKLPELARPPWLVAELDDCVQLAGRLNNLADWELTALRGVFASRHPATMEEVLTMTQGLERVPVVRGIGNDYVEQKIHHLMMVLSALPELEVVCADSYDSFEDNKRFLTRRLDEEQNPKVRALLEADVEMLDRAQAELSAARQFLFLARCRGLKEDHVLQQANRVEKTISDQGFEVHRLSKPELKRFLAIWFKAGTTGDQMPDVDGAQYVEPDQV